MSRILFSFILFISLTSFGQLEGVNFMSPIEQSALENSNTINPLNLFLGLDPNLTPEKLASIEGRIQSFIDDLDEKKVNSNSPQKIIKYIHEKVHKKFLKSYEEISPFHMIFDHGVYNCVSGTALFALIFDQLNIPYSIQELPTHVYLIAYPDNGDVIVESTDPKKGYYVASNMYVHRVVKNLVDLNLVEENYVENVGERKVYNDFFYSESDISIQQLAGLQYYNDVVEYFDMESYVSAYSSIQKSMLLYPSHRIDYINWISISEFFNQDDAFSQENSYLLFSNYVNSQFSNKHEVERLFHNFLVEELFTNGKASFVDSVFQQIKTSIKDSASVLKISAKYYSAKGSFFEKQYNISKSLDYYKKAYQLEPENVHYRSDLSRLIVKTLSRKTEGEFLLTEMAEYEKDFPFLKDNNLYMMMYFYVYATIASEAYDENDGKRGDEFFNKAESSMNDMDDLEIIDDYYLGMLYAEAGAYYYRQKDMKKALEVLEKGNLRAPDHPRITARIDIVKSKM